MSVFKYFFLSLGSLVAVLTTGISLVHAAPATNLAPGDLIKGRASTVYYYGSDGKRYVFPNEKTYFSWYADFSGVHILPDAELAAIPLGSNITYRPGKRMVKIESDSRVYVIDRGGYLRHVVSEQLAQSLYGLNWKDQIMDVPVVFFKDYKEGPPVTNTLDYRPAEVATLTYTIAQDKFLPESLLTVTLDHSGVGFVPSTFTIKRGTRVEWVNRDGNMRRIVGGDGWDSRWLQPGQSFSRTFDQLGSFDYQDAEERAIRGNINVK